MQHQICPRCKFRITSNKAICTTCGYSLHSARSKAVETVTTSPAKPSRPVASPVADSSSLRKTQAAAPQGPNFWRTFFGLDQIVTEKSDRDELARGET